MTKDQINAKYVAYVQQTIAENKTPDSFSVWNQRRIEDENTVKSFTFPLWSETCKAYLYITVKHHDKDIAFLDAKKNLTVFERKYAEGSVNTKQMTTEERIADLQKKIIAKREAMQRKILKLQESIAKKMAAMQ